jgi:hypothetical protein
VLLKKLEYLPSFCAAVEFNRNVLVEAALVHTAQSSAVFLTFINMQAGFTPRPWPMVAVLPVPEYIPTLNLPVEFAD